MPEKTPPVYKWAVALAGESSCTVEAAYPVLDEGHMLLKDSDHKIVFAAAPGTGCNFTRMGLASATSTPARDGGDGPAPVSFDDLLAAWHKVCVKAWDDDAHWEPSVTLPDFLWPHVAAMVNPVTGNLVQIRRATAFTWGPSHDGDHGSALSDDAAPVA